MRRVGFGFDPGRRQLNKREMVIDIPTSRTIIRAGAARDAAGLFLRPAAVIVVRSEADGPGTGRVAGILDSRELSASEMNGAHLIDLPDVLLLPMFVNAHAHLDLTLIGPRPYRSGFTQWVGGVMRDRPRSDESIQRAILDGARASLHSGVASVGDILGVNPTDRSPASAQATAGLGDVGGVAFVEMFSLSTTREQAREAATICLAQNRHPLASLGGDGGSMLIGVQPHAPYSAGLELYQGAAVAVESMYVAEPRSSSVLSTHLAETMNEDQFVRDASGPFVELLKGLGKWDGSFKPTGRSPIEHLAPALARARWVAAHCNYVSDADIQILARHDVSVAYCPIASAYFGHAGHRYRDMVEAGVNVCLGTDSILCQPPGEAQPLGILPQARFLRRRDQADPQLLLKMATINGNRALGGPVGGGTLRVGMPALLAGVRFDPDNPVDPWLQVLEGNQEMIQINPRTQSH